MFCVVYLPPLFPHTRCFYAMEREMEETTARETETGACGSPRGVDDRHEGDLRCD